MFKIEINNIEEKDSKFLEATARYLMDLAGKQVPNQIEEKVDVDSSKPILETIEHNIIDNICQSAFINELSKKSEEELKIIGYTVKLKNEEPDKEKLTEYSTEPKIKKSRKKKSEIKENIVIKEEPTLETAKISQRDYSDPKIAYKYFMDVLVEGVRSKKLNHDIVRNIIKEVTLAANDTRDLYAIDLQKDENTKYIKDVVERIELLLKEVE